MEILLCSAEQAFANYRLAEVFDKSVCCIVSQLHRCTVHPIPHYVNDVYILGFERAQYIIVFWSVKITSVTGLTLKRFKKVQFIIRLRMGICRIHEYSIEIKFTKQYYYGDLYGVFVES